MKKLLKTVVPTVFLLSTHLAYADSGEFKRWAVSAGWLHVMPQGKANTTHIKLLLRRVARIRLVIFKLRI